MNSSPAQLQNLAFASDYAAVQSGIDGFSASSLTQDQRLSYLQILSDFILSNPDQFSEESVSSAAKISHEDNRYLNLFTASPDGSRTLQGVFMTALADTILGGSGAVGGSGQSSSPGLGGSLANLGTGVENLISRSGNVISNVGKGAEVASETASYNWLVPVAVVAFVALLTISAVNETRKAARF